MAKKKARKLWRMKHTAYDFDEIPGHEFYVAFQKGNMILLSKNYKS